MKVDYGKYTFFYDTFRLLSLNPKKFKYRLKNNKFDINEKKLLLALEAISRKDKETVFILLKNKKFDEVFLDGVRLFLLGFTNNYFCMFSFGIEDLEKSVKKLKGTEYEPFLFHSYLSLLVCYSNRKDPPMINKYIKLLNQFDPVCPYQKISLQHALCVGYLTIDKLDNCELIIKDVKKDNNEYLSIYESSFCLNEFLISLKRKDIDSCGDILNRYKNLGGFSVKANYLYMKKMMDHLYLNAPLYVYRKDFELFPELFHQLQVLKDLSTFAIDDARNTWSVLQKHNSELYRDDFVFQGDFSLFSIGLDKYKDIIESIKNKKLDFDINMSPMEKIHFLFENNKRPFTKEKLIELIWNEEISELSLVRLRQLIYRYNKKYKGKLISYQDTYKISA